jgi:hypothetical protein
MGRLLKYRSFSGFKTQSILISYRIFHNKAALFLENIYIILAIPGPFPPGHSSRFLAAA